jgi:DNA polymerase-3 subunit alpha
VNKKVLESLTLAGAFDSIAEVNRPSLFASLEGLLEHAGDEQEERELGQSSLFDAFTSDEVKMVSPAAAVFKNEPDWPQSRKLVLERQVVGFYVSGHPMDTWQKICEDWLGWSTERIKNLVAEKAAQPASSRQPEGGGFGGGFGAERFRAPKTEVKLCGLFTEMKEITTKKGARMAFATLEDLKGKVEAIFFPEAYGQMQEILRRAINEAEPVVVQADVEHSAPQGGGAPGAEAVKILVKSVEWTADAHRGRVQKLRELKKHLLEHRGKCPVRIDFVDSTFKTSMELPATVSVAATPQMVASINRIFGRDVVALC